MIISCYRPGFIPNMEGCYVLLFNDKRQEKANPISHRASNISLNQTLYGIKCNKSSCLNQKML